MLIRNAGERTQPASGTACQNDPFKPHSHHLHGHKSNFLLQTREKVRTPAAAPGLGIIKKQLRKSGWRALQGCILPGIQPGCRQPVSPRCRRGLLRIAQRRLRRRHLIPDLPQAGKQEFSQITDAASGKCGDWINANVRTSRKQALGPWRADSCCGVSIGMR